MRILQVIHQFPPHSSQGSEVYCLNLSRELARDDEVGVFHVSNVASSWRRQLRRSFHAGLAIFHCVDGGQYARLADWPNPFLAASFRAVLEEFRPEVVHFHNFLSLGDDLPTLAQATRAAVAYTLHDFGLICPNALLLRDDGVLCGKDHADFFQDCCPVLIRTGARDGERPRKAFFPSLARWQRYARQRPWPLRAFLVSLTDRAARWRDSNLERKRAFFFAHTRAIFRDTDLFFAPSDFLLRRYRQCGLGEDKLVLERYGIRHFPTPPRGRRSGTVRFGYIGALHPQKGIELLLEAFRGLDDRARLHIFGSAFGSPISQSFWTRIRETASPGVTFRGPYENEQVGTVLADLDAVVVPSLWYENAPLTIQESFIAGVPVITADIGGMAELVKDGAGGLRFRAGDAVDLRAKLQRVIEEPALIDELRRGMPPVPTIGDHAVRLLAHYRRLLTRSRADDGSG